MTSTPAQLVIAATREEANQLRTALDAHRRFIDGITDLADRGIVEVTDRIVLEHLETVHAAAKDEHRRLCDFANHLYEWHHLPNRGRANA
jgi:DICT domain-containing protein